MEPYEYDAYIREIVEGNEEWIRAEGPLYVATSVVVSVQAVDGESLLNLSADPYNEGRRRLYPKEILDNTQVEYPLERTGLGLREYAVECLRRDIEHKLDAGEE